MKTFVVMFMVLLAAVACDFIDPGPAPTRTPDLPATVEAAVEDAIEATQEAEPTESPTNTPRPTPTTRPTRTPTPTPTPTSVPTPEPHVADPGNVEQGVDLLVSCMVESEPFQEYFITMLEDAGEDPAVAAWILEAVAADPDGAREVMLEEYVSDPDLANLASLLSLLSEEAPIC